jgi:hypothetical protein
MIQEEQDQIPGFDEFAVGGVVEGLDEVVGGAGVEHKCKKPPE